MCEKGRSLILGIKSDETVAHIPDLALQHTLGAAMPLYTATWQAERCIFLHHGISMLANAKPIKLSQQGCQQPYSLIYFPFPSYPFEQRQQMENWGSCGYFHTSAYSPIIHPSSLIIVAHLETSLPPQVGREITETGEWASGNSHGCPVSHCIRSSLAWDPGQPLPVSS